MRRSTKENGAWPADKERRKRPALGELIDNSDHATGFALQHLARGASKGKLDRLERMLDGFHKAESPDEVPLQRVIDLIPDERSDWYSTKMGNLMNRTGIKTTGELCSMTRDEFRELTKRGYGPRFESCVVKALAKLGFRFKGDPDPAVKEEILTRLEGEMREAAERQDSERANVLKDMIRKLGE